MELNPLLFVPKRRKRGVEARKGCKEGPIVQTKSPIHENTWRPPSPNGDPRLQMETPVSKWRPPSPKLETPVSEGPKPNISGHITNGDARLHLSTILSTSFSHKWPRSTNG